MKEENISFPGQKKIRGGGDAKHGEGKVGKLFGEGKSLVWKGEEKWRRTMRKIFPKRKMSRWQTGTHGDRHCEDRSRILVLEFVIGQCVSRPPVEGYNIAEPLVCQLMCYQVQNPEPENMRHNMKKK